MKMNEEVLAPIVFFAYNRPEHTERVLSALMCNKLANESKLYIYVDGIKEGASLEEKSKIQLVRTIVSKKKWCQEVTIKISDENAGCRNSIIQGITEVIDKYGKAIILEDDILTSAAFLIYMNKALDMYEHRFSVFSISGHSYSPNNVKIPEDYEYDAYISPRLFNWGWATWKDRWNQVDWDMDFVPEFVKHTYETAAFNRGGEDMTSMLIEQYTGKIDAWDIQFAFTHFANHAVSIVPCQSYTINIGFDGSGTHCAVNKNMDRVKLNENEYPVFPIVLYENKQILNSLYSFYYPKKRPIWKKIINRIYRFLGNKNVFDLKKKVYV